MGGKTSRVAGSGTSSTARGQPLGGIAIKAPAPVGVLGTLLGHCITGQPHTPALVNRGQSSPRKISIAADHSILACAGAEGRERAAASQAFSESVEQRAGFRFPEQSHVRYLGFVLRLQTEDQTPAHFSLKLLLCC